LPGHLLGWRFVSRSQQRPARLVYETPRDFAMVTLMYRIEFKMHELLALERRHYNPGEQARYPDAYERWEVHTLVVMPEIDRTLPGAPRAGS
jgi:hypothetical protein